MEVLGSVWGSKIPQKSMIASPQIGLQIGIQIGPQGPQYCSLNPPPVEGAVMEKVKGTVMEN